jgi:thiol:disulfide interchange protein
MFEMIQARLMPVLSTANARRMGRSGLHQACLIVLTGLVIQLALGMILNLYIIVPAADARISYLREIETAPGMLTAHALLALVLLATAGLLLLRAIALRDMAVIAPVATGLAALIGAFAAGEVFVRNNKSSASLSMAILTGVALLCYICLQAIIARQRPSLQSDPDPRAWREYSGHTGRARSGEVPPGRSDQGAETGTAR